MKKENTIFSLVCMLTCNIAMLVAMILLFVLKKQLIGLICALIIAVSIVLVSIRLFKEVKLAIIRKKKVEENKSTDNI